MAERSIALRISVRDVQEARQRLLSLGEAGETALARIEAGGPRASTALRQIDRDVTKAAGSIKGGLSQAGFQLTDFMVQVEAGTPVARAFSQQFSQLASGFGPLGIAIGTGVAALGSLAGLLIDSADAAESATEAQQLLDRALQEQTGSVDELAAAWAKLTTEQRALGELAAGEQVRRLSEDIEAQREAVGDLLADLDRLVRVQLAVLEAGDAVGPLSTEQLVGLGGLVEGARRGRTSVLELAEALDRLADETGSEAIREAATAALSHANALEELGEQLDAATERQKIYADETGGAARAAAEAAPEQEKLAAAVGKVGDAADASRDRIARMVTEVKLLDEMRATAQQLDADAAKQRAAADQAQAQARAELDREFAAEQQARADLLAAPFQNALRSVQNTFADTFEAIFSGGVDSFSDLAEAVRRIFIRMAAEVATLAIFRPSAVLGAANATGFGGAGGSFGGLGGLLDQFGTSFGFGGPVTTAGGVPFVTRPGGAALTAPGALGSTSLSSVLGAAGLGFAGGSLFGGAIGGPSGAFGGGLGGGIGAAAGSVILPGIGTVIGGVLGTLIGTAAAGGFAGSTRNAGIVSGGLGDVTAAGSGDLEGVASVVAAFDRELIAILNSRQEKIVNEALRQTSFDVSFRSFDANVGAFAVAERGRDVARALGFRPRGIAGDSTTPQEVISNLASALQVEREIQRLTGAVSAFDQAIEDLEISFEDLDEKARRFGVSVEGLSQAQEDAIENLRETQDAALARLLDPFEQLISPLEQFRESLTFAGLNPVEQFEQAQAEFRRLGAEAEAGSISAIEQIDEAGLRLIQAADVFGASPAAAAARDEVLQRLSETIGDLEGSRAEAGRDAIEAIQRADERNIDRLDELIASVRELINETKRGRNLI